MAELKDTLAERGSRYGTFESNARVSQELEAILCTGEQYSKLHDVHKEALKFICQKMSRIVNGGDPFYADNWHDIGGFAKLAEDYDEQSNSK